LGFIFCKSFATCSITSPLHPHFGHINARLETLCPQSGHGINFSPNVDKKSKQETQKLTNLKYIALIDIPFIVQFFGF
jgi:hypothetical protein